MHHIDMIDIIIIIINNNNIITSDVTTNVTSTNITTSVYNLRDYLSIKRTLTEIIREIRSTEILEIQTNETINSIN